jgi:hypothetical protein
MRKEAAVAFLMTQGLSRKIARNLLEHGGSGVSWEIRCIPGQKGQPIGVYPLAPSSGGSGGRNNPPLLEAAPSLEISHPYFRRPHGALAAEMDHAEPRLNTATSDTPTSAAQSGSGRRKLTPLFSGNGTDLRDGGLFSPLQTFPLDSVNECEEEPL